MIQNMIQIKQSTEYQVAGNRLPVGAATSSNAAIDGKDPTRMKKNHGESVSSTTSEKVSPWRKFIAIGALSSIALTGCVSQQAPEKPQQTTEAPAEEPAEPTVEAPAKSFEELVNERKIEAGLSAEDYARTLIEERFVAWLTPIDKETFYAEHRGADGKEAIRAVEQRYAAENTKIFTNATFIPGWESVPSLSAQAAHTTDVASVDLGMWARARYYDEEIQIDDEFPEYQVGMVVERVEVLQDDTEAGTRTLLVAGYETNNITETSIANEAPESFARVNGSPWTFTVKTEVIDGVEYVTEFIPQ